MFQDEMARMVAERLFGPAQLLTVAGVLLFVMVMGYASRRLLLRLPDFPYRQEMLWGARWMWAIIAAVLGVAMGVTYYGAIYTDYPLTFIVMGGAVFPLGMGGAMSLRPMRAEGWGFCFTALGARLRGQRLDMGDWVTKRVRQYHKPWIKYGLGWGVPLTLVLMNAYAALAYTYPFDREFGRTDREQRIADQVAAEVRERLQGRKVVDIQAYGPMDLDAFDERDLSRIRTSLRELLALDDPPPSQESFRLFIEVMPDTNIEDAESMLEQARAGLEERHDGRQWDVSVYVRDAEVLARGEYP